MKNHISTSMVSYFEANSNKAGRKPQGWDLFVINYTEDFDQRVFEIVSRNDLVGMTGMQAARVLGKQFCEDRTESIILGWTLLAILCNAGLYKVLTQKIVSDNLRSIKDEHMVHAGPNVPLAIECVRSKFREDPSKPLIKWDRVSKAGIDIVSDARDAGVLADYNDQRYFDILNAAGEVGYVINDWLLDAAKRAPLGMQPRVVLQSELTMALKSIKVNRKKAKTKREAKFEATQGKATKEDALDIISELKVENFDHIKVISEMDQRKMFDETLKLADYYSGNELHFRHFFDSRLRFYPVAQTLNPQSTDLAKALLLFKEAKPRTETAEYWLKVQVANSAGKDKLTYEDRVKFYDDNKDALVALGTDPWDDEGLGFILANKLQGEALWMLLATCRELVRADGMTQIPLGLDATCSGTQILTGLTRDDKVAEHVNLTRCTYAPVGDLYNYIGSNATWTSPKMAKIIGETKVRKVAKRGTMTYPYSAGAMCMGEQIFEDKDSFGSDTAKTLTYKEALIVGSDIYNSCKENLLGPCAAMQAMKSSVKGITNALHIWHNLDLLQCFQFKPLMVEKRAKAVIEGYTKQLTFYVPAEDDKGAPHEHQTAISPNIVHSMDAYLMASVMKSMGGSFTPLHDQFSCHAGDVPRMQQTVKTQFKKLVSDLDAIKSLTGVEIPVMGSWDLSDIDSADYMVC